MDINESAISIAKECIAKSNDEDATVPVDVLKELVWTLEGIKYVTDHWASLYISR